MAERGHLGLEGLYTKRFDITSDTRISTVGSCFAQHIGRALREAGFNVQDFEPPPPALPVELTSKFGYGLFSARFGNVYTARQLLQLFREAFGGFTPGVGMWSAGGRFFDPLRPSIEENGFGSEAELRAMRQDQHLPAVRRLFLETEVLVFTLGLTEAWILRDTGAVFPVCPGVVAGVFDPSLHGFHNFSVTEVIDDMDALIREARSVNPALRILLTVSPVPLTATAEDQHVLVATAHSKAILRAAAGDLYRRYDFVDYFPSFEMVMSPQTRGAFFEPNLRSVTPAGVAQVMACFLAGHDIATQLEGPETPSVTERPWSAEALEIQRLLCDDERLDPELS